ncbi:serine/threonine-protein phosphatase 6 regulatory ankyrin repeat subunit C [Anopheles nili]|uniref:serine/threonine-protein phosphatase 6 regulatory ankyrin repeat subunit C n=1 Tax=Anopheles nili TaxID=185578 RepID=UPI00237AB0BF|nr:serine/threonine-protein phosphatase 6 regulatory ankyrin repeat subunit C [Anopheles nili]
MFTEKLFDNLGVDMIASNDSEESMEKFSNSIGGGKYQTVITDLGKALLQAARIGNTEKVHELMSRGAPFTADWLGTTPLHLAARYNHIETCKVLLRAGISKDSKTKVDRTPLHMAVYHGNLEVVELLLSNKCEVDAKDMLKMTALHWAVEKHHDKIVEMLLQHGADPNAVSKFNKTPIQLATDTGQSELVRILLLANQMRAASCEQVGVQEATDSLMYELQQHKERHLVGQQGADEENAEVEDAITMDLSNDSNSNLSVHSAHNRLHNTSDTDLLIEKEDSLSDAITNLVQSTKADPKNLDSTTLQMLKDHGITLMPSDDTGSLITSAIKSGRKIVLSEAGKFALKETRNMHTHHHQPVHQLHKQTIHPVSTVHGAGGVHPKTKTIKIIKKQSSSAGSYGVSIPGQQHHSHLHHVHQSSGGTPPTIKTNKVIKILSAEEFKQICGGEVGSIKRVPSSEYKKAVTSATVRVPINSRPHVLPAPGGGLSTKHISKIVMTKSGQRIPVMTGSKSGSEVVQAKLNSSSSASGSGSVSLANGLSSGHNRHIITSADGVKRLRTATGMEIISSLPTKLPQDTVVSVETSPSSRVGSVYHRVTTLGNSTSANSSQSNSTTPASSLMVEMLERQLLEVKKQTEDLRKQFELSQKQNEEYRTRVQKLEKEVQTLKQGNAASSMVEII